MSKSFANSSLGRNLPSQANLDLSRMGFGSSGFGQMGQGSNRVSGFMDSKMGPQRSVGMMSSGSSQGLSSAFRLGSRGSVSSQPAREPDAASKILASFGLSSSDLDELSRFPEDKITAENLPEIIQHLKRRREGQTELNNRDRLSRDNWDNLRSLKASFDDRSSGLNPMGDFGLGDGSSNRGRMDIDARDQTRLSDDSFLSDPFRKMESDYNRVGFGALQEKAMFEKTRGMPSARNIDDFHGLPPKAFPHLCSLCDFPINSFQNWEEHISGRLHKKQCLLLLDLFPQWKGDGAGTDPFLLQRSTNPAPGIMGPTPPQMSMGGPSGLHGNSRRQSGMSGSGKRQAKQKQGDGRVVHIVDIQRTKTLKPQLMKLVEPFGTVTNSLILNSTKEAFIEMATPAQARAVVNYFEVNPAYVYGKPVRVLLSLKYKEIKKREGMDGNLQRAQSNWQGPKLQLKQHFAEGTDQPVEGVGRVVRLCNLPKADYADHAVVQLAKKFGKIKNYILMRKMRQAFIEMEKLADAQAMMAHCTKTPLMFKGRPLQVLISQKYSSLVLKIPNSNQQKNRKRSLSLEGKGGFKKQRNNENDADIVTTEEDLVTDSCDPELEDEEEVADASNLDTSGSGDEAEVPDITDLGQSDLLERLSSTPAPAENERTHGFHENTEDEMGNEPKQSNSGETNRGKEQPAEDMDIDKPAATLTTRDSVTETNAIALTIEDLGPYQPSVPTGVNYVIAKTGYYCRLCSLFYTNEDMAKVTHCSSLAHYQKLKALLTKQVKSNKKTDETTE